MNPKLLNNYLKAVKTFLPGDQQDDIAQELSDDILSRVEAQSAQLGRPLTEPEQEAILKQVGNPVLVDLYKLLRHWFARPGAAGITTTAV
jgi:hypothetical protein